MVLFQPDASKGNHSPFEPAGTIDEEGTYTLLTKDKKGAPPGWYKIVVTALAEPAQHPKGPQRRRPVARSLPRPNTAWPKPAIWRLRWSRSRPPGLTT